MAEQIQFTEIETAALTEAGYEFEVSEYGYVKRVVVPLGCGCCHDSDRYMIRKYAGGTYVVSYWPAEGRYENADCATFEAAINYF
jgi:hypothetical protein